MRTITAIRQTPVMMVYSQNGHCHSWVCMMNAEKSGPKYGDRTMNEAQILIFRLRTN